MKPWSRKFQNVGILSSIPAHARALARGEAAFGQPLWQLYAACPLCVVRCTLSRAWGTCVQVDAHFGDEGARHLLEHRIEDL